ncbi:uncharacterized protein LOC125812389 [Solanum verrucosum]|uniref:uncharacterized protein LOC125812389 n=1 Tax=Solanum verrucosum TaxID=315347 RepID=UPI0020D15A52|nr:uncharacterized protein LOC125812389 [Solanum verrucosum]
MGKLVHYADHRASRLENSILGMILTARADAVTTLSAAIDALVATISVCERGQRDTEEVTTLKAVIVVLRSDVDQLTSTDMPKIFGMVEIPDVPDKHLATTGDKCRVEETTNMEFEAETDEEIIEVVEETLYEGLTETEEAMVDEVVQAYLLDTPLADPSAVAIPS